MAQEDRVGREDQVGPRQQNDRQGSQPNPPSLQDHQEGQEVLEGLGDLVVQGDPEAREDLVDQRQNLPVLLQSRPSMHLEIPVGQEVREDREDLVAPVDLVDQEGQLRLPLKHPRHQNQVRKNNKATKPRNVFLFILFCIFIFIT